MEQPTKTGLAYEKGYAPPYVFLALQSMLMVSNSITGHFRKNWKLRWFRLQNNVLFYFRTQEVHHFSAAFAQHKELIFLRCAGDKTARRC